jgi:aminocarboxymuconate-semialdehyde decarboxylase
VSGQRVDIHTHILPRAWPDLADRYGEPRWPTLVHHDACSATIMAGGGPFRRVTHQCFDVPRRIEDMDRAAVDMQVLSTVPVMFSYWGEASRTRELSRYLNEHLASVVEAHPDRFAALGTVPLNDPGMAVEELERCVGDWGMSGVEIATNVNGVDLSDARFEPFFQRAADLRATVFIHPWQAVAAHRLPHYYFLYSVAMPAETAFAVGAVIFSGLLERIPDLRLLFAHGGGSVAYIIGRMQRGWDVWEPAREHTTIAPIDQLRRCWFDALVWDDASFRLLLERVGPERVLLGSDYPFIMGEDRPGELVERADVAESEKQLILGDNARNLLSRQSGEATRGVR